MKTDSLEPTFRNTVGQLVMAAEIATGLKWVPYSCRRTMAEQKVIYDKGHNGKDDDGDGKIDESDEHISNAPPGYSSHNYGLGCDCAPIIGNSFWWNAPDHIWKAYADAAQSLGLTAGYYFKSFKDMPHVESPIWKLEQDRWKRGELDLP